MKNRKPILHLFGFFLCNWVHNFRDMKLKFANNMQFDGTYWLNLVLLKNIDVWPKKVRCPYLGICFFSHNSGNYCLSIELVIKNHGNDTFLLIFAFFEPLLARNGRGHHMCPYGSWASNPNQKWPCYFDNLFSKFWTPL